jgi:hypothetical protein
LRARPEVELRFADVAAHRGIWERDAIGDLIVLDVRLRRRARRCVLAHELIHAERGIGHPVATPATMQREEELVRRETARRLVPPDALEAFLRARVDPDAGLDGVTAEDVADEFDVEPAVAAKALSLLPAAARRPS